MHTVNSYGYVCSLATNYCCPQIGLQDSLQTNWNRFFFFFFYNAWYNTVLNVQVLTTVEIEILNINNYKTLPLVTFPICLWIHPPTCHLIQWCSQIFKLPETEACKEWCGWSHLSSWGVKNLVMTILTSTQLIARLGCCDHGTLTRMQHMLWFFPELIFILMIVYAQEYIHSCDEEPMTVNKKLFENGLVVKNVPLHCSLNLSHCKCHPLESVIHCM